MCYMEYDVVIAGGGASGMMAAALFAGSGLKVALVEKNGQCGRKLLLTGKGRCNMTNACQWEDFKGHIHPDPGFFRPSFMGFSNRDTVEIFASMGLKTIVERGNRVFPVSGRSADVRDALLSRIASAGNVDILYNSEVVSVLRSPSGHFVVEILRSGDRMRMDEMVAPCVIVATGGLSYPVTGSTGDGYRIARSLGHTVICNGPVSRGSGSGQLQSVPLRTDSAQCFPFAYGGRRGSADRIRRTDIYFGRA